MVDVSKVEVDIANKWVKALESGDYPQTSGILRDCDGFCCLGVLAEVMELPRLDHDGYFKYTLGDGQSRVFNLSKHEYDRVGLEVSYSQEDNTDIGNVSYYVHNNDSGMPFEGIASALRIHYQNLGIELEPKPESTTT